MREFLFYSYPDQLVWRAARGTGAAPSFFRAMGPFLDGGMIANNPTLDVLTDIHKYNRSVRGDSASPFGLVVSLGTGVPPPMHVASFDVFKPESIWDATNVLLGARALGELLVDQVTTEAVLNLTKTLDSDDDFRSSYRNVSHCHRQQSFSGLPSSGRSHYTIDRQSRVQTLYCTNKCDSQTVVQVVGKLSFTCWSATFLFFNALSKEDCDWLGGAVGADSLS